MRGDERSPAVRKPLAFLLLAACTSAPPAVAASVEAPELQVLHTRPGADGDTRSEETAWQGGQELVVAEDGDVLHTSIVVLWGRDRLYLFLVARGRPGELASDEVTLSFAGARETVLALGPQAPLAARLGGAGVALRGAASSVEQGDVDWFAELSLPAEPLGLAPAEGARLALTATRCAARPGAAVRCVSSPVTLVLVAEEATGP